MLRVVFCFQLMRLVRFHLGSQCLFLWIVFISFVLLVLAKRIKSPIRIKAPVAQGPHTLVCCCSPGSLKTMIPEARMKQPGNAPRGTSAGKLPVPISWKPSAMQMRFSRLPRSKVNITTCGKKPEEGVLAVCKELGIGFVPYSPLTEVS